MAAKRKPAITGLHSQGIVDDIIAPVTRTAAKVILKRGGNKRTAAKLLRSSGDRKISSIIRKEEKQLRRAYKNAPKAKSTAEIRKEIAAGRTAVQNARRTAIAKTELVRKSPYRGDRLKDDFAAQYVHRYEPVGTREGTRAVGGKYYTRRVEEYTGAKKAKAAVKRLGTKPSSAAKSYMRKIK